MTLSFKSRSFLLLVFSFAFTAYSQDILWEKSLGGKHAEFLFDAIATPDYGFILAGSSISDKNGSKTDGNKGNYDYWLWKMSEKGEAEWQKSFGGPDMDLLQSIQLTADGGFILAGTSLSPKGQDKKDDSKGGADFWIIKLDAKGNELWQKTIGGTGQEKLKTIIQTRDGGYLVGGSSASEASLANHTAIADLSGKTENSRGNMDYWIVKLDKDGKVSWQKTLGGLYEEELKSIVQTKDEGYVLGGYSNSPASGEKTQANIGIGDYWIVKLDKSGNLLWDTTLGGDQDDHLSALIATTDGGFLVGGNSNSASSDAKSKSNGSGTDFWVLKLDENGKITWQQTYNFGKLDVLTSLIANADGSYLVAGYAQGEEGKKKENRKEKTDKEGINDYIALKIDAKGEELWSKTVGSKGEDILKRLMETRDGGYLLAGTSKGAASRDKSGAQGSSDFWIVKLKDKSKPEHEKVTIEALPNPAETFTNAIINYEYTYGTATLYDLNGRQLQQQKINGERTVPFDLSNLPSGVYVINISTNVEQNGIKVIKK
ncbi:T9SS type A sorting domain-containing protein [Flavobacterium humi]|uniref:T9SS type A sorting domain-containing protein n=1 Tax=Flavobacterium humi TaxID=2562683 RepID=A0A4Z0L2T9_9FLAO|nr:T9SS type A sorting domain-containing protein [Flavobacterium humi]TGD56522.1 T9SS type A sorting domain-containing protein [Flavobacterium humi]